MFIVCIAGKMGAGKDEIANQLIQNFGFTKMAMADTLKKITAELFDLPIEYMNDRELKEKPLVDFPEWTPRRLLQVIGTDCLRKLVHPDIHVYNLVQKIKKSNLERIVVSDIRFPNEKDKFLEFLGPDYKCVFLKAIRENNPYITSTSNHESEQHEIECDFDLYNSGTVEEFRELVNNFMTWSFENGRFPAK